MLKTKGQMMKKRGQTMANMSLFAPFFFDQKGNFFHQKCHFGVLIERWSGMMEKKRQKKKLKKKNLCGITCNGRYPKTLEHKSRQIKIMRELSLLNSSAKTHILRAPELANTRRLHATKFATTSTIVPLQVDAPTPAKDEPPR